MSNGRATIQINGKTYKVPSTACAICGCVGPGTHAVHVGFTVVANGKEYEIQGAEALICPEHHAELFGKKEDNANAER